MTYFAIAYFAFAAVLAVVLLWAEDFKSDDDAFWTRGDRMGWPIFAIGVALVWPFLLLSFAVAEIADYRR